MSAAATIEEAQGIARHLVEHERGRCGGSTELALHRVSSLYGVDQSNLRALWHRRARKLIAAHVMDNLRQVDAWLKTRAATERRILNETAVTLERCGSPVAGLARKAAQMAGEEDGTK